MLIVLRKDLRDTRGNVFSTGTRHEATFIGAKLWMRGLRHRPLQSHEWYLILDDDTLDRAFPPLLS
jgi:hypothetical protein